MAEIKINGAIFEGNENAIDIRGENSQIEISKTEFINNKQIGEFHLGDKSKVNIDDIIATRNGKGLTFRDYNENLELIEQFVKSDLYKLDSLEVEKIKQILGKINTSDTTEEKTNLLRELYDLFKNGGVIPLMGEATKKAFELLLGS